MFYWFIVGTFKRNLYQWYDDIMQNAYMEWETTDEILADEFNVLHFIGGAVITVLTIALLVVMWMVAYKLI